MLKNRLAFIIKDRGIKQTWLAEKAGIDRSTLSSVIANKKSTNLETGIRIAQALDMYVEDIFEVVEE